MKLYYFNGSFVRIFIKIRARMNTEIFCWDYIKNVVKIDVFSVYLSNYLQPSSFPLALVIDDFFFSFFVNFNERCAWNKFKPEFWVISCFFFSQNAKHIDRQHMQLVGIAALFLASKYEEITVPAVEDLVYISAATFKDSDLYEMEREIFRTIRFDISRPISLSFLRRYSKAATVNTILDLWSWCTRIIRRMTFSIMSLIEEENLWSTSFTVETELWKIRENYLAEFEKVVHTLRFLKNENCHPILRVQFSTWKITTKNFFSMLGSFLNLTIHFSTNLIVRNVLEPFSKINI